MSMTGRASLHTVEPGEGYFLVTSASSGRVYRVVPFGGFSALCTCKWAHYRSEPCSHVLAVRTFATHILNGER